MHEWIRSKRGLCFVVAAVVACLIAPIPGAEEAGEEVRLSRAVTCLEIQGREPVNIDTVFSNQAGEIYCYTHVEGARGETAIEHVWLHEGEERARVSLPVRSSNWRTWSSKRLLPSWTGDWKVEVHGPDGNLLKTLEFTVTGGEAGEPQPDSSR